MDIQVYKTIEAIADKYTNELKKKIDLRTEEMKEDDNSHYLIYQVLGISNEEGNLIDFYQNKGRFLYKYAGAFLEEAATVCIKHKYPNALKTKIPNTLGSRPKNFEIDCLVDYLAHEIKWRDATTDGDHITKEHTRVKVIHKKGFVPVRVMFYYPQRTQAKQIQETLKTLYQGINGQYYSGDDAWQYIKYCKYSKGEFVMLYHDDCLNVLKTIDNESIDMIYLDPPFYTQSNQKLCNTDGKQYEFLDVWKSRKEYLDFMNIRLLEMKRVLKTSGTIFLHCNTSASHYLRILLDNIFGENNFRNEIIWYYKRWSNSQKSLLPAHQTILFYSKTNKYKFFTLYHEYSPTTNIDQILQERQRNKMGKVVYKRDANGNIIVSKEKKGVPMSDIWEIPFLNPKAKERTGYPTQKPIELLERIIKLSTEKDDCVLDPFCGSGTTLVSAKLLDRKFIGIDTNLEAIKLCQQRLEMPFKTNSNLLKVGANEYKTKTEEELSILKQFDCDIVQRNKGIDAFLKKYYLNAPVAIKIQKKEETFIEAVQLLNKAATNKHCSFMILITYEQHWKNNDSIIPKNMIIITRYETQFQNMIQEIY